MSKTAPINTLFDTPLTSISIQGVTGEFQNKAFSINANGKLVIGRELSCDIKFNSTTPNVSRKHCTVSYDGNTVWLTDNSSSFGTFLDNGTKLVPEQRVALSKGNGFYLGNRDISFTIV